MTTTTNDTRKVAFLVASEGIERVELTEPWKAVADAGFEPVLVSPEAGEVQTFDHLDRSDKQAVDVTVADANVDEYAALVLPGGVANPTRSASTRARSGSPATSSPPASRSPRSATRRGRSSRPTC